MTINGPLAGRVAVVTGVGRRAGIGFAIARELLAAGAGVLAQSWTALGTLDEVTAEDLEM